MGILIKNKKIFIHIAIIMLSAAFIFIGYCINKIELDKQKNEISYAAQVISVEDINKESVESSYENLQSTIIRFKARIMSGELKNEEVEAFQYIDDIVAVNPKEIETGDKIIISLLDSRTEESKVWTFLEYNRINILLYLTIGFLALIVVFGNTKGINTIISLVFTILSIFVVYIPSILKGNNVYLSSIIISVFIIFMTILIINGVNKKSFCAIVGNLGGLLIAGLLAFIASKALNMTGLIDQDSMFLVMVNPENPIDLKAILWGSIVIGSLGAVMDVSMSIASAMNEIVENSNGIDFKTLLKSGINIGRDAMGTMTNTLILAYIGSSLSVVLLLVVYYKDTMLLFSLEMIVHEIMQAVIGSMGILFAIPVTSLFSSYVYMNKKLEG